MKRYMASLLGLVMTSSIVFAGNTTEIKMINKCGRNIAVAVDKVVFGPKGCSPRQGVTLKKEHTFTVNSTGANGHNCVYEVLAYTGGAANNLETSPSLSRVIYTCEIVSPARGSDYCSCATARR